MGSKLELQSELSYTALTCSIRSDSLWPTDCQPTSSFVHRILQERILECVAIASLGISWPRTKPMSPKLAGRFFTHWATIMGNSLCFPNLIHKARSVGQDQSHYMVTSQGLHSRDLLSVHMDNIGRRSSTVHPRSRSSHGKQKHFSTVPGHW